jgi:catechol 2,3-dioxygenase-like lactoylglutathione lyase family enzyme
VTDELVNVRYMAGDVEEAVAFYTTHVGFTVRSNYAPAFADVVRGHLRRRPLGWGYFGYFSDPDGHLWKVASAS